MDTTFLIAGFVLSTVGLAFFVFGKKQRKPVPLAVGVVLMVCPYLVTNPFALAAIGIASVAVAYFVRI